METKTTTFPNVGPRIDRLPTTRVQWGLYFMVAFALLVGWSNAIGGLILAILKDIGWTDNSTTAIFTSLTTAGMFFGALIGGAVGDKIGRRNGFMLFALLHIITMLIGAASPNMTFFIVDRFVMGFALGAVLTILFASWTEYVPGRDRGSWSSRASFIGNWSYPIASLLASFLTAVLTPDANWRIQLVIPAVTSSIVLFVWWRRFPESPRWLENQGRYEEANAIVTEWEERTEKATGEKLPAAPLPEDTAELVQQLPYSALFKGQLLRRVIVASFVLIAMNVVQYTLINWLPTMLLDQGIDLKDSVLLNTMSMFGAPIGIFIAIFLIDRIPRKVFGVSLLLVMAVLGYIYSLQTSLVALSIIGFFLIIFVYMYVCFASAVYAPEIWPTAAKLRGSGVANAVGRVSGILSPFAVAALLSASGMPGVFLLLGGTAVVTAIVLWFMGVETRGVSIEEISALDLGE